MSPLFSSASNGALESITFAATRYRRIHSLHGTPGCKVGFLSPSRGKSSGNGDGRISQRDIARRSGLGTLGDADDLNANMICLYEVAIVS